MSLQMNQKIFDESIESIEIAFGLIEFAYRIQVLGPEWIQELFYDDLEVKSTLIKGKNMTVRAAMNLFSNHINALLCAFWVAIDEAFDKALGKKHPKNDSGIDDFRAVIFMFRCAFAHGISEPKWCAQDSAYRRRPYLLSVPLECRNGGVEEFYFDFDKLNGQNVKTEAFKQFRGVTTLSQMACWLLREEAQTRGFCKDTQVSSAVKKSS